MRFVSFLFTGVVFLFSCSYPTFYEKTYEFNKSLAEGHFDEAEAMILNSKKLEKGKFRLLYFVNAGMVEHLKGDFATSNEYFNKADVFLEDEREGFLEKGASLLLNPNLSTYYGEDHEVLMIHYYKSLNYYLLGQTDEALVEVRRLNLKLETLSERYTSERKFSKDAFMHVLMGLIYEANNDYNNAFIAFRNAYDIYEGDYVEFFDQHAPEVLKRDLIRSAHMAGLWDEKEKYEEQFGLTYESLAESSLVVLWNNGMGPIKEEWGINFAIIYGSNGWVTFVNEDFGFTFPFYIGDTNLAGLTWVKVVFPKYVERPLLYTSGYVEADNVRYDLELGENVNDVSFKILEERMMLEFSKSLIRVAIKQAAAYSIGNSKESPELSAVLSFFASATESADTRNWQTLPHSIYYQRIPVNAGANSVVMSIVDDGETESHTLEFVIKQGQTLIYPFYSLGSRPAGGRR